MTVNERVCRNVKALCEMNHIALGEVEKKLGKNPGFFSRRRNVSPDMMVEIASMFEMTLDDLMKLDFEKYKRAAEEKENLINAVKALVFRMNKDEMMKLVIHIVNCAYKDEVNYETDD